MKSEPRMEPIVFAFAGDSTITSALPTSTTSLPRLMATRPGDPQPLRAPRF